MKINISSISRSVNSSMKVGGELIIPQINYKGENVTVNSPITVEGVITNTGEHFLITGTIKTNLTLKCSRCLEDFEYNFETDFEEELSNKGDDIDVVHFEGDVIDITDIIVNNIFLALPMKFVCNENCKGLCPRCGKNINIHECSCTDENLDPRLAVLKDLLKGD